MKPGERMVATYEFRPVDHLCRVEFYIWEDTLKRWRSEGLPEDWEQSNLFDYDPPGVFGTGLNLGWTEPPYIPQFEDKVVEVLGDHEIVQDRAGRLLRVFRGRRDGFMPEYLKHPVSSMADWEAIAPRLDPHAPGRWDCLSSSPPLHGGSGRAAMVGGEGKQGVPTEFRAQADAVGGLVSQNIIGGYMYLRALIGPVDLLYLFYDQPELIHAAMQGWLRLMDAALARVQAEIEIDEIFIAEDVCYNHGPLISPDAIREYLLPYYQQLLGNARARQNRKLYFFVDTDGDCRPVIPLYLEIGMTRLSPFEVASGCDVVAIAKQYPYLIMSGGIDKRVLAAGKDAIERHLQHILPFMVERGGYFPTCDHGVPPDVSFEDYRYYRRRACELDHA